jgi:esterase
MNAVTLNYKDFGSGPPLIILHGLFGSLDNWQTIAKKLAEHFHVFIIDQRNHGKSPHTTEFSYELLVEDLRQFMQEHSLTKASLIGHSMGGKAAMAFALKYPEAVDKLIVVDVAPVAYDDKHSSVFDALFAADAENKATREEVQEVLRGKLDNDETTVQFLMKGLTRNEGGTGFTWKFNVDSLHSNYSAISGEVTGKPFMGKTLFIKGEKSNYVNAGNYTDIQDLFPQNELTEVKDAGHWVHAEKPADFTGAVLNFLLQP